MIFNEEDKANLKRRIRWFLITMITFVINALLICFWALIQFLVYKYVLKEYQLYDIDKAVLVSLQKVFGIATVIPVFMFIVSDLLIIGIQCLNAIKKSWKK